jgi:hypothetical protein
MTTIEWQQRHKHHDPIKEDRHKEVYELSADEADKQWQRGIKATLNDLEKFELSDIPNHIAAKWELAARMLAVTRASSYEVFCSLLVEWRILSWTEIKHIDAKIWSREDV